MMYILGGGRIMQFTDWFTEEAQERNAAINKALYGKNTSKRNDGCKEEKSK